LRAAFPPLIVDPAVTPVLNTKRRRFLKRALAASTVIAGGTWFRPTHSLAAGWPQEAFSAKAVEKVLTALYGRSDAIESLAISFKTPVQAENGALVPIEVSTTLPQVESIAIIVDKNPQPLVANTNLSGAEPFIGLHIRMHETSAVRAMVRSEGQLYTNATLIKVTVSGYGG
jgi:sulfur-oxidizing protein SoxY